MRLANKKLLNDAGQYLQRNPFQLVVVTAYTGLQGEKDKNVEITHAQASVVRDYLVQNFKIDDARIRTKGIGEKQLDAREKSGRVEVMIYA